MDTKEAGKLGSLKRWARKYEMLVELSKHYDKRTLSWIATWKIPQIAEIYKMWVKKNVKRKNTKKIR
jgi:hypothetical protein